YDLVTGVQTCALPILLTVRSPAIWKIQTSVALPDNVTSLGINKPVPHSYTPAFNVRPPTLPAPSSVTSGARPAASVNAVSMSPKIGRASGRERGGGEV